jgi:hypothetical protein
MVSRSTIAWLVAMTGGCAPSRTFLGDADEIRLDAVVELTAAHATRAICLSVDPRSGDSGSVNAGGAFSGSLDPEPALFQAVSRMGPAYPGSRCEDGDVAGDGAIRHPGGSERSAVVVTLGAVGLSADRRHAELRAVVSTGALTGEWRHLDYRREGLTWRLSGNTLLSQE